MRSDPRLFNYYQEHFAEAERLGRREGQLELVRTQELLRRSLPEPPAKIVDVGGGTGIYAAWLASLGHEVHLIDIVPRHAEQTSKAGTYTVSVGDARALFNRDGCYDVAILLGPLYHLRSREGRLMALGEARRVVRPGGLVVAAFISRGAVAMDGYVKGWIDRPDAIHLLKQIVRDGLSPADRGGFGAIAYFHLPSEARAEIESADLTVLGLFGVEGPGWIAADFDERWQRPDGREVILESARACEAKPELQTLSAHLLAFCRRL